MIDASLVMLSGMLSRAFLIYEVPYSYFYLLSAPPEWRHNATNSHDIRLHAAWRQIAGHLRDVAAGDEMSAPAMHDEIHRRRILFGILIL